MAKKTDPIKPEETIILRGMEEVMHASMMPYAEHVILERALPRVEDGLKPVQRRILYSMLDLGLSPDKPHRKSARIVGDCLGKYHPHGDSSVYDAMVRMAQPFNMGATLVDGHGNFGSIDGDSAAAMRYTEARMTPAAMQILRDLESDTVPFVWNFDDTIKEPELLPGRFPNLLVNGASGIAVGLATNIPPHNPAEAINAVIAQMLKPNISLQDLMKIMPAPDFPTGGYILASEEIEKAYATGRGKLTMRAKTHLEPQKNGKTLIVITELPYQVNKARLLENILAVSQEKRAQFLGISDIRDESDRNGMRAVVEVKKDVSAEKILQLLYKYTDLQCTFGCNFIAIADGRPQQLSLKEILSYYIAFQKEVVTRRTKFELDNAKKREHILEGLMVAVDNVDEVIRIIRASKSPKEARMNLMARFKLTEIQAQAILDLRLQRLTSLELLSIEREYKEIKAKILYLQGILGSEKKLLNLIQKELTEIRDMFPQPRQTVLLQAELSPVEEVKEQEIVEDVVVTLCAGHKIRKSSATQYKPEQAEEDGPIEVFHTQSNVTLRFITDTGEMLALKAGEIPDTGKPKATAINMTSLVEFADKEKIIAAFAENGGGDYFFCTAEGNIKRVTGNELCVRAKRTVVFGLKEGDRLIAAQKATGEDILLVTERGQAIRFAPDSVPAQGRGAGGVRGIKLEEHDRVCHMARVGDEGELLLLTDKGYGKRSFLFDFETQGRGGKGLRCFEFKKNGGNGTKIAHAAAVTVPYDMEVIQRHGGKTVLNTEHVKLESRAGRGTLCIPVVLDDDVTEVNRTTPA
ncbi:MAG: DNA topoisomerase 4 subunit A [Clostridiales bacterium]|nr:DNA topoisomerase 4 subunit A [Clostridiales bacterium]